MSIRLLPIFISVYLLMVLQGCAMTPLSPSKSELATTSAIPAAEPALDHYIAWIPRDTAQTATVARALTHTALGNARQMAGDHLCGGVWIGDNKVTNVVGPIQAWASEENGGYAAWYYRISHLPGVKGCTTATDVQIYQAMAANLPKWLSVQAARMSTVKQPRLETTITLFK